MLLFIIFSVIMLVLSLLTIRLYNQFEKAREQNNWILKTKREDRYEVVSTITIILGILYIAFLISTVIIISMKPTYYIKMEEYKYSLEAKLDTYLESDKDIDFKDISWQELYEDIKDYNSMVKKHKYWSNNIFLNWFYSKRVGALDLIEYKGR